MAPPPPPDLMEELVEEILLRFPPDDPASLARAALVCRLWCRLACGPVFRRRFREFHFHRRGAAPPLLGVLYGDTCEVRHDADDTPNKDPDRCMYMYLVDILQAPISYFVPTTSFRPAHAADGRYGWCAIDARHGRVLLRRYDPGSGGHGDLCVWDPVTDEQRDLPAPPFYPHIAAVVCAAAATATADGDCDHLDCSRGPFLVVVMCMQQYSHMRLSVYSSEAGAWSEVTLREECPSANSSDIMYSNVPGVLVRRALYTLVQCHCEHEGTLKKHEIVKYDLATRQVSSIRLPSKFCRWERSIVVMADDGGGLGFVAKVKDKLELWSRVDDDGEDGDDDAGFVLTRVIDLQKVLPSGTAFIDKSSTLVNGFADGGASRVLFIRTQDGLYSIEINSSQVRKLDNCSGKDDIVPFISFCTPSSRIQH